MAIDTLGANALGTSSVTSAKITDGTIATGDIANDAVTGTKLANDINIAGDLTVTGNDINTAGAMLLRPAGSERVNIATNGLAQFKSSGISAGNQVFQVIDDGATLFQIRAEDGNISFPQAGAGIYLGVTAGNAANLLDDYEEGTWTPNCATAGVSGSYSVQMGRYIKVGNLVQCIFNLTTSGSYTGSTSSVFKIGGLPFANKFYHASLYAGGNIGYYFNINTVDTCKQIVYQIPSGSDTSFELKGTGDNQGEISIIVSNFNSNSVIRGQLVYHTA